MVLLLGTSIQADNNTIEANFQSNMDSLTTHFQLEYDSICSDLLTYSLEESLQNYLLDQYTLAPCTSKGSTYNYGNDSIYMARLQALPTIMQMSYNQIVKRCIERYIRSPKQVASIVGMGESYYFPIFEASLAKYNVPLELKYLPVIESGLNPKAYSRAGAAGLWQFIISTGRGYKLEISSLVDERCDPLKASDAAAHFLSDLYKIYGDWNLVIAAYNCGPGNVAKAIRYANGATDYWKIYPYLPRETRSYVPIFIAANYIMNYYTLHNICPATPKHHIVTDTLMINRRVHLQQVGDVLSIPMTEMRELNPQYFYDIIPGNSKPYSLVLPLPKVLEYIDNSDSIYAYKKELVAQKIKAKPTQFGNGHMIRYKVKRGDTLGGIAHKYHVKVSQLKRWNHIKGTFIREGQRLKIYK